MTDIIKETITIRLHGKPTDDGRTYVTSPDLRGFYFVLETDEDPITAMEPTLKIFMSRYLKAEIMRLLPAMNLSDYRARKFGLLGPNHGFPRTLIAAVA